jgi:lipid II:glycine glycyltransferase (peptidoglycan interpeptide bridge formation enzyme)
LPIADGSAKRLRDVPADETFEAGRLLIDQLAASGWTQQADTGAGFGDVQPRYVFQVPLAGRSEDEVFAGFNQLWRRNVRKAEKLGVTVIRGGRADLAAFHPIYVETAARDGFVPRGLHYFERMWDAMSAEDPDRIRVYLANYDGTTLAATTMVNVGNHSWYSYGASADAGREVRPSNAIQWKMIKDSLAGRRRVYDMRGISDTLDESDPLFGLIRFKLGTGGQAVEYVGEWDYALRPAVAKAFDVYLRRNEIRRSVRKRFTRTIATDSSSSQKGH